MSEFDAFIELYFGYAHLPAHLQAASKPFSEMARSIVERYLTSPGAGKAVQAAECKVALRKLLESKDAAVRSCLPSRV